VESSHITTKHHLDCLQHVDIVSNKNKNSVCANKYLFNLLKKTYGYLLKYTKSSKTNAEMFSLNIFQYQSYKLQSYMMFVTNVLYVIF